MLYKSTMVRSGSHKDVNVLFLIFHKYECKTGYEMWRRDIDLFISTAGLVKESTVTPLYVAVNLS